MTTDFFFAPLLDLKKIWIVHLGNMLEVFIIQT